MNSMASYIFPADGRKKFAFWTLFCLALGLLIPGRAPAQQSLYQNLSDSVFHSPPTTFNPLNSPPQIQATAFDNESTFDINFDEVESLNVVLFETSDTLYYTNGDNGLMIATTPLVNLLDDGGIYNGNYLGFDYTYFGRGAGFQFDYQTSNGRQMAGTFYNSGTIRCDSILDGGYTYGTCNVFATNIYNPGNIVMGIDSLMQLDGQTVDLSRSVLSVETLEADYVTLAGDNQVLADNIDLNSVGRVGTDTNYDWNPGGPVFETGQVYPYTLGPSNAVSSYPYVLDLTNSGAYMEAEYASPNNTSNIIYRTVFVQNDSPNAPYNVYIQSLQALDAFGANGGATIEWIGTYIDPATGNTLTNYLYLNNDYVLGASTNAEVLNGVPNNFTFLTSPDQLAIGATPITEQFYPIFYDLAITNPYSYMDGQFSPSTASTNVGLYNPYGTVTNVDGRIEITATKELNLNNALITGENYLSIQATNQFDGSAGATISAPYSDINLGVTNATQALVVSNLLESAIPHWSGVIQAWSTRWIVYDPTTLITNDFRVLLVYSQLQPTTQPWVNNLNLHSGPSRSLIVSDDLNIYGSLYLDAQKLTITTNGYGFGAQSVIGELNAIYPGNLGPAQWPNLQYLTNNGAMGSAQQITLAGTNPYGAVINTGTISDQGTTIVATNFVNGGLITNGIGNMSVQSFTTTLTNDMIYAQGGVSIGAGSLVTSNTYLQCLSLSLYPTNSLTDSGVTNGNIWVVGRTNGTGGAGLALLNNPRNGDLLGTTITNICPAANKQVKNIWAGHDYGASNLGYTNNAAVGRLILDVAGNNSLITFAGTGTNNAIYVDSLEFRDALTNGIYQSYNFTNWLALNPNIVIYFAQAYVNGISIAEKINNASLYSGENGGSISNGVVTPGRLRWVPSYAGYFSSTNFVVNGVTNSYNAALAQSTDIDSDGSGLANAYNPSPFFAPQQINFALSLTNLPPQQALLTWDTVPLATNYVYYTTSLATNKWLLYTSFTSTNVTGSSYPVSVLDTNKLKGTRFYKVTVAPWLTYPY